MEPGWLPLLLTRQVNDEEPTSVIYGLGKHALAEINGTTVTWYHQDRQGSTTHTSDNTGATLATFDYDEWGNLESQTGTTKPVLGWVGEQADPTGLVYLRARYYDPTTAQFLTIDPLVSQTNDPYGYAGNNPVNFGDPRGLSKCEVGLNPFRWGGNAVDCAARVSPVSGQATANVAGGVLNGLFLGHAKGVLNATGDAEKVHWDSDGARVGNYVGTGLSAPLAFGAPNIYGAAVIGSGTINGYQCWEQGPTLECGVPAVLGGVLGAWGAGAGSRGANLGALFAGNLLDINFTPPSGISITFALLLGC